MSTPRDPKHVPLDELLADDAQRDWLLRLGTDDTGVDIDAAEAGQWALRVGGGMAADAAAAHGLTALINKVGVEKR